MQTLDDVTNALEAAERKVKINKQNQGLLPFLQTYILVARALKPEFFVKPNAVTELNIHFVKRYLAPLKAMSNKGKVRKPWQTYADYCLTPNGSSFLQMILGVNAHINGDFAQAIADCQYRERRDFLKMNKILERQLPLLLSFLALKEHDLLAGAGMMLPTLADLEFRRIVIAWRLQAWKNAQALKKGTLTVTELHRQTEAIAERLKIIFADVTHLRHLPSRLCELHRLQVGS